MDALETKLLDMEKGQSSDRFKGWEGWIKSKIPKRARDHFLSKPREVEIVPPTHYRKDGSRVQTHYTKAGFNMYHESTPEEILNYSVADDGTRTVNFRDGRIKWPQVPVENVSYLKDMLTALELGKRGDPNAEFYLRRAEFTYRNLFHNFIYNSKNPKFQRLMREAYKQSSGNIKTSQQLDDLFEGVTSIAFDRDDSGTIRDKDREIPEQYFAFTVKTDYKLPEGSKRDYRVGRDSTYGDIHVSMNRDFNRITIKRESRGQSVVELHYNNNPRIYTELLNAARNNDLSLFRAILNEERHQRLVAKTR